MRPTYTAEDAEQFRSLLLQGKGVEEIANHTGFTPHTVTRAIRVVFKHSIRELRDAHGMTASPSPRKAEESVPAPLPRVRLPSDRRKPYPRRLTRKTCPFCGTVFQPRSRHSTFCSHSCSSKARKPGQGQARAYTSKQCENCGDSFRTFRADQKYCGDTCRKLRLSEDKTQLTDIVCQFCEKMFRPPQRGYKYCSKACAYGGKASGSFVRGSIQMPDGKKVRFIGTYELAFLLYAKSHSDEYPGIDACRLSIPYELNQTTHNYYPDFTYTRKDSVVVIVELKSAGTIEKDPDKHMAKVAAAEAWCALNGLAYLLLDDHSSEFQQICSFVRDAHNMDALAERFKEDAKLDARFCKKCATRIPRTSPSVYKTRVFCSRACRNTYRRSAEEISATSRHECPACGTRFVDTNRNRIYCSKACYTAAQRTLEPIACQVCGGTFQPCASKNVACSMKCGIVCRVASRLGLSVSDYLDEDARNRRLRELRRLALPDEMSCVRCGEAFKPTLENIRHCSSCVDSGHNTWTLPLMLTRLQAIRDHLDGRVPKYSELYHSPELKKQFNSCSLAGALYRHNQAHEIGSYADFCEQYLGWLAPRKLSRERLGTVLKELVRICGGIPASLGQLEDVLGYRGGTIAQAVKFQFGETLGEFCERNRIRRIALGDAMAKLQSALLGSAGKREDEERPRAQSDFDAEIGENQA